MHINTEYEIDMRTKRVKVMQIKKVYPLIIWKCSYIIINTRYME